jgi:hypothetical protein
MLTGVLSPAHHVLLFFTVADWADLLDANEASMVGRYGSTWLGASSREYLERSVMPHVPPCGSTMAPRLAPQVPSQRECRASHNRTAALACRDRTGGRAPWNPGCRLWFRARWYVVGLPSSSGRRSRQHLPRRARSRRSARTEIRFVRSSGPRAARSGQRERAAHVAGDAERLALFATRTLWQAARLGQVAGVLAAAGQHERAEAVAGQAETLARSTNDPPLLGLVAVTLARAGQFQQAEALGRSITEPIVRAEALRAVASVPAGAGMHRQAETLACSITALDQQAEALTQIAEALAGAGFGG